MISTQDRADAATDLVRATRAELLVARPRRLGKVDADGARVELRERERAPTINNLILRVPDHQRAERVRGRGEGLRSLRPAVEG